VVPTPQIGPVPENEIEEKFILISNAKKTLNETKKEICSGKDATITDVSAFF
jgi:hypothetical protein